MTAEECKTTGINNEYCHGKYRIANRFSEPLLLYVITDGGHTVREPIRISPGKKATTPRLAVCFAHDGKCDSTASEYKFYFKTEGPKEVRFGMVSLIPHACRIRNKVLTPGNFQLAADGPKP